MKSAIELTEMYRELKEDLRGMMSDEWHLLELELAQKEAEVEVKRRDWDAVYDNYGEDSREEKTAFAHFAYACGVRDAYKELSKAQHSTFSYIFNRLWKPRGH